MKKLPYLFLVLGLGLSCSHDLNGNYANGDYFFEIEFAGETHIIRGPTEGNDNPIGVNQCMTYPGNIIQGVWYTIFSISDKSSDDYVSGQNLQITLSLDNASVGINSGTLGSFTQSGSFFNDYLESVGVDSGAYYFNENEPATYADGIATLNEISNINITDLGTESALALSSDGMGWGYDWGETVKGSYEGVLYFQSSYASDFDIPVPIRIEFNAVRYPQ
jgi:hypothetical protein